MTKNFFRLLIILMLCFNYSLSKSNINAPGAKNTDWEVIFPKILSNDAGPHT